MPTDPVYNPSLPNSALNTPPRSWTGPSSASRASTTPNISSSSSLSMTEMSRDTTEPSSSSFVAGLIAGACAGAALALMFAPARGSDVRRSLRGYASEGSRQLSRLVENGRSLAGDAVHRASSAIEEGRKVFRTRGESWSVSSQHSAAQSSQPLTASVAEITGVDRRFEEPLGG